MDLKHIRHIRPILLVFGLAVLVVALAVMLRQTFTRDVPPVGLPITIQEDSSFKVSSPVLGADNVIPSIYTCNGARHSPPLSIENPPDNTKEFVLTLRDASQQDKIHWLVWNIPASTTLFSENQLPEDSVQGTNDFSLTTYEAPCPVAGSSARQEFVFELYALDETITLDPTTKRDGLVAAMNGKTISKVQFTGYINPAQ